MKKYCFIILFATIILASFIITQPVFANGVSTDVLQGLSAGGDIPTIIGQIIQAILGITGAIALFIFVWGGMMILTAAGNTEKIGKGKQILVWAVIGIAVILSSFTLVGYVITAITGDIRSGPGISSALPGTGDPCATALPGATCTDITIQCKAEGFNASNAVDVAPCVLAITATLTCRQDLCTEPGQGNNIVCCIPTPPAAGDLCSIDAGQACDAPEYSGAACQTADFSDSRWIKVDNVQECAESTDDKKTCYCIKSAAAGASCRYTGTPSPPASGCSGPEWVSNTTFINTFKTGLQSVSWCKPDGSSLCCNAKMLLCFDCAFYKNLDPRNSCGYCSCPFARCVADENIAGELSPTYMFNGCPTDQASYGNLPIATTCDGNCQPACVFFGHPDHPYPFTESCPYF